MKKTISPLKEDTVLMNDTRAWEQWLAKNHARRSGVWLKIAKKGSSGVSVPIGDALETALCYGWIDAQRKGLDDDYFVQRYTPRTSKSSWSALNKERAERLMSEGRMKPSGLHEIEKARQDGRWETAYQSQKKYTIPKILRDAFAQHPNAGKNFARLGKSDQYQLVLPLMKSRTDKGRQRIVKRILDGL